MYEMIGAACATANTYGGRVRGISTRRKVTCPRCLLSVASTVPAWNLEYWLQTAESRRGGTLTPRTARARNCVRLVDETRQRASAESPRAQSQGRSRRALVGLRQGLSQAPARRGGRSDPRRQHAAGVPRAGEDHAGAVRRHYAQGAGERAEAGVEAQAEK